MKNFKLAISIATMCLALMVLCFGVYSATNVTYNIGGSISYSVNDVFVKINTKVFKVEAQQDIETMNTNIKTLATKSLDSIADSTYILSQTMVEYDSSSADGESLTHDAKTSDNKSVEIVYGKKSGEDKAYYTYYIVINIQNLSSSKDVSAYITDKTTSTDINGNKATNTYQNTIKSTETRNIVIAYSIVDKMKPTTANFNYTINVSYDEYVDPYANLLQHDADNDMWYINYGTYNGSPIKWRYVGTMDDNGTIKMTKYTYSEEKPTGLAGRGVFVQQSLSEGSDVAFDTNNSNNYYNSSIRTKIKDGTYFNLSEEEKTLNLAMPRTISSIKEVSNSSGYQETTTDKYTLSDSSTDKFWLMSLGEVNEYLGTTDESREFNNQCWWWLRSPLSKSASSTMFVTKGGRLSNNGASLLYCRVRAAFILSADATL